MFALANLYCLPLGHNPLWIDPSPVWGRVQRFRTAGCRIKSRANAHDTDEQEVRMRRRLTITISALFLVAGLGWAVLVAQAANESGGPQSARQFVGYWMGIDPLDGGDVRRGITANDDGTFSMIGHDSVLTLCGGTDRGIIRVDDFTAVGSATLVSDNHVLTCTNNGQTIIRGTEPSSSTRTSFVRRSQGTTFSTRPSTTE